MNSKSFLALKVTGNALNIEYYFWWRDYCFGLLIHHNAPFHFMVSISVEYKYKRLVKTAFKSCGKPYLPRNLPHAQLKYPASELASFFIKNASFQPGSATTGPR